MRTESRLRADTIGPMGLAALAIGITSPAIGLYATWGPMQSGGGPITPLIFLAAMVLVLPTAISYAQLNREAPSAGAASTWLWIALSPASGFLAGLFMTTYFFMAAAAQPLMFSLFFLDLLEWLHLKVSPIWGSLSGVLLACVPVAWVCLRGAEASIKLTIRLMVIETLVVLALSATVLITKSRVPDGITFEAFDPRLAHGFSGFCAALIFGVLDFCGFDVVSTAAEEARAPRAYLPKAILLTVVAMGVFWALNAWAFTLSIPDDLVRTYTAEGLTAVTPMAEAYWGDGRVIIILTAFTGITAVSISSMQGVSRIVFALARHHLLPSSLAALAGEKRVPRTAVLTILLSVVGLDLGSLILLGNGLDAFSWWANALVFFATLTFLSVNAANILFLTKGRSKRRYGAAGLLVPILGVLLNGYLLYAAFFLTLWGGSWRTGKSVVTGAIGLLVLEIGVVIFVRVFRPALLTQGPPLGVEPDFFAEDIDAAGSTGRVTAEV